MIFIIITLPMMTPDSKMKILTHGSNSRIHILTHLLADNLSQGQGLYGEGSNCRVTNLKDGGFPLFGLDKFQNGDFPITGSTVQLDPNRRPLHAVDRSIMKVM